MASKIELIPVEFLLGFFIYIIVARWWSQFSTISWPENLMILLNSVLSGDENRASRRAIARWTNLVSALAWGKRSLKIRKRFPTTAHLVRAGLMTPEEQQLYQMYQTPFDKWWIPTLWILDQLRKHRDLGTYHPSLFRGLADEVEQWRAKFQQMLQYDWVCLPLVYTQVGEALIDPFGEDDEDFELNWILDRNTYVAYMMVDTCANQLPPPDPNTDPCVERSLPYTKAAAVLLDYGPKDHLKNCIPALEDRELVWANFQGFVTSYAEQYRTKEPAANAVTANCIT